MAGPRCRRRLLKKKNPKPANSVMPSMAPTTIPAIAPVPIDFEVVVADCVVAGPEVAGAVVGTGCEGIEELGGREVTVSRPALSGDAAVLVVVADVDALASSLSFHSFPSTSVSWFTLKRPVRIRFEDPFGYV